MLMGMLAAGGMETLADGVREPDEDNPRGYHELEQVKQLDNGGDSAWVAGARGKCVKVISFLLRHLPVGEHYKIVFVRRNLQEVLASQRRMLQRRGEHPGDVGDPQMEQMFAAHLSRVERELAERDNCEVLYVEHRHRHQQPADRGGGGEPVPRWSPGCRPHGRGGRPAALPQPRRVRIRSPAAGASRGMSAVCRDGPR